MRFQVMATAAVLVHLGGGVTVSSAQCVPVLIGQDGKYLGNLSANQYDPQSINNPYGTYGSQYSAQSVRNPYGQYGSPFAAQSTTNRYAVAAPKIVDPCTGQYLGQLSANPYAPDSTGNKFGTFGSPFSPSSINNRYGPYGGMMPMPSATGPAMQRPPFQGGIDPRIPLLAVPFNGAVPTNFAEAIIRAMASSPKTRATSVAATQEQPARRTDSLTVYAPPAKPRRTTQPISSPWQPASPARPPDSRIRANAKLLATSRPLMPAMGGFTAREVEAFLGSPASVQRRTRTVTAWVYPSPWDRGRSCL